MSRYTLHQGDSREVLKALSENSVDAIVCDPPYGLAFMGKKWDYDVPGVEIWAECLRVLKPGGHLLAFAGTRTQHRMAVRIEDAGFEIRDMIAWVYGSGFPKSLDVSKAIDKVNGEAGRLHKFTAWMRTTGLTGKQINDATGTFMGSHYLTDKSQPAIPTPELWARLRPLCGDVPVWVDELVERIAAEREVVGRSENGIAGGTGKHAGQDAAYGFAGAYDITAPATDAARQWQGWGTALKPALEPITMARKPLAGTVAANVLEHGTGALNIDGCRVAIDLAADASQLRTMQRSQRESGGGWGMSTVSGDQPTVVRGDGRWPANLIHDGSDEVVALFPREAGAAAPVTVRNGDKFRGTYGAFAGNIDEAGSTFHNDTGSAARFFYCAKASKRDRDEGLEGFEQVKVQTKSGGGAPNEGRSASSNGGIRANIHPTVKPVNLMAYLCRLVTPPGGVVLDPFMGSGSTGKAAMREGFHFIGIDLSAEYIEIARARIDFALRQGHQPSLLESA